MTDWNALTFAGMAELYPGSWDVLRGVDAPDGMPVCASYPSLMAAVGALQVAGFAPTRFAVLAPELDGPYDLTTCMRLSAGEGMDVVVVRRVFA